MDIVELGVRYRADGAERVKAANRDVATTGRDAAEATDALTDAQGRRPKTDRAVTTSTKGVTTATHEATTATRDHINAVTGVTRAEETANATAREWAQTLNQESRAFDQLRASIDPVFAASKRYEAAVEQANAAVKAGVVSQQEANRVMAMAETRYLGAAGSARAIGPAMDTGAGGVANLAAQFNDIGVMMASGQSPLILALQQGTQIGQVFGQTGGGAAGAVRALGSAFKSVVSPINLATIGIIAGGAALFQWGQSAFQAEDAANDAAEGVDGFTEALDRYEDYAARARSTTADLRDEYGEFADAARENARLLAQLTATRAVSEFSSSPLMEGMGRAGDLVGRIEAERANIGPGSALVLGELERKAASASEAIGMTTEEVAALRAEFAAVAEAETFEGQARAAQAAIDAIIGLYGSVEKIPAALTQTVSYLDEVVTASARANESQREMATGTSETMANLLSAADNMQSFGRTATRAAGETGEVSREAKVLHDAIAGIERSRASENVGAMVRAAGQLRDQLNLSNDQVRDFDVALKAIRVSQTFDEQARAIADMVEFLDDARREGRAVSEEGDAIYQALLKALDQAIGLSNTDMASGVSDAANEARRFADELTRAFQQQQSLREEAWTGLYQGGATPGQYGPAIDMVRNYADMQSAAEKGILELIAKVESAGDYNKSLESGRFRPGGSDARALVNMTINEVLAEQRQMLRHPDNHHNSSAAGRYQIVSKTLRGLVSELGLTGNELYSPQMQDRLAMQLLRRRQGQGVSGLRNEWEGLRSVPDELIQSALGQQSIERIDPQVAAAATRAQAEATRAAAQADREATQAAEQEARATDASQRAYDQLVASLDPAQAATQRYEQAQQTLNEALERGQISQQEYSQSLTLAREEYQQSLADFEEGLNRAAAIDTGADDLVVQRIRSISDAMAQAIVDGENMGDALEGVFKQIASSLISSGIQTLMMQTFGGVGGGGGLLGGLFGGLFGGARADGGPVSAGKMYLVGERGPEMFRPATSGQIVPNHAMGGSSTFAPVYHIDARGSQMDEGQFRRILDENNRRVKADMQRSMKHGPKKAFGLV